MGTNYNFSLGYGFKITFDNFIKRHINGASHSEIRYDEKTGKKKEIEIIDHHSYDEFFFNGNWVDANYLNNDFNFEDDLGPMAEIYYSYDNDNDFALITANIDIKRIDSGNVDVSWQDITILQMVEMDKVLNLFKDRLAELGCIGMEKIENKYTCCPRIG
jgi:hypothetical protein